MTAILYFRPIEKYIKHYFKPCSQTGWLSGNVVLQTVFADWTAVEQRCTRATKKEKGKNVIYFLFLINFEGRTPDAATNIDIGCVPSSYPSGYLEHVQLKLLRKSLVNLKYYFNLYRHRLCKRPVFVTLFLFFPLHITS